MLDKTIGRFIKIDLKFKCNKPILFLYRLYIVPNKQLILNDLINLKEFYFTTYNKEEDNELEFSFSNLLGFDISSNQFGYFNEKYLNNTIWVFLSYSKINFYYKNIQNSQISINDFTHSF